MSNAKQRVARLKRRCQGCKYRRPEGDVLFVTWKHPTHPGCTTGAWLCGTCRQLDLLDWRERQVDREREESAAFARRTLRNGR